MPSKKWSDIFTETSRIMDSIKEKLQNRPKPAESKQLKLSNQSKIKKEV